MNVVILSESSCFPWGMAATSRVRNIAKALLADQASVEYVGLRGASVAGTIRKDNRGYHQNIKYDYPGGITIRPSNWLIRRIDDFFGFIFTVLKLFRLKITGRIDLVIIYSCRYIVVVFWTKYLHLFKIPVVLEICEWPLAIAQSKNGGFKHAKLFCYHALLNVDAVLTISTYIENEIKKIARKYNKHLLSYMIPILLDVTSKKIKISSNLKNKYLLYSGAIAYLDIAMIIVDIIYELKSRDFNLNIKNYIGD